MKTIKRRRLEAKTDYGARLNLLKSGKPRLVVRKTNRYIVAQLISSDIAQDKILSGTTSKALLEKGWPEANKGSLKTLAAAYLTGYLLGKKAKVKEAILDIGMNRNVHKARIYAVLKGVIDAGVSVPHSEEALPTDDQLKKNAKVGKLIDKIKEKL